MGWPAKCSTPSARPFYFRLRHAADVRHLPRLQRLARRVRRTDPARLKGIGDDQPDDVQDGIKELERAACLGLVGAMITEYPFEDRRYDWKEYELAPRRRRARPAFESAYGHATARQDSRCRRADSAGCQQPRDEGVLSGNVTLRYDLFRCLRASPRLHPGHRGIRFPAWVPHALSAPWTTRNGSATAKRFTVSKTA